MFRRNLLPTSSGQKMPTCNSAADYERLRQTSSFHIYYGEKKCHNVISRVVINILDESAT
jgi:hypothetical protein